MKKIAPDMRVETLVKEEPKVISFLESLGFKELDSESNPFRKLTLSSLAAIKKTDVDLFLKQVAKFLDGLDVESDITLLETNVDSDAILTLGSMNIIAGEMDR